MSARTTGDVEGGLEERKRTEIVGDNDDTARELFDGRGQRVDGSHIQVIGRLIQQNDVRVLHGQDGENDSVTFVNTVLKYCGRTGLTGSVDRQTIARSGWSGGFP